MIKYSIIIPTYNHCEDLLKPCIEGIVKNTDLDNVEVIIVSNGSTDGTDKYVESLKKRYGKRNGKAFHLLSNPEPMGYAKANNWGISKAQGQYVILLNNDAFLLPQKTNTWLNLLEEPFRADPDMGITGPFMIWNTPANHKFLIFFCVMIKRKVFDKIGVLDEAFGVGGCEDVDFCVRAAQAGFGMQQVPDQPIRFVANEKRTHGAFPIFHQSSVTVSTLPGYDENFRKNEQILRERYRRTPRILCSVSTRNRYDMLSHCVQSIAMQTLKPSKLIIFDDGEKKDLREDPIYKPMFRLLQAVGIEWEVAFGRGQGQHLNHQIANTRGFEYVWRIDDDEIAEPDVLEKLMSHMTDEVGAVGGAVFEPGNPQSGGTGKLIDVYDTPNIQWMPGDKVVEVEHLYSSFVYRAGLAHYNTDLSPVAHREETLFSHALHRLGYKLIVDLSAKTYHFRQETGGIREHKEKLFYEHDEAVFAHFMSMWGYRLINLSVGLGDHLAFLHLIPALKRKWPNLIIGCCCPEVFEDCEGVKIVPLAATQAYNSENVYKYMADHEWAGGKKGNVLSAFAEMYGVPDPQVGYFCETGVCGFEKTIMKPCEVSCK